MQPNLTAVFADNFPKTTSFIRVKYNYSFPLNNEKTPTRSSHTGFTWPNLILIVIQIATMITNNDKYHYILFKTDHQLRTQLPKEAPKSYEQEPSQLPASPSCVKSTYIYDS